MARFSKEYIKEALQGVAMVIIAILTVEATSLIQYYYSQRKIHEEATRRAEDQIETTNLLILGVMDQVETAVRNNTWAARKLLRYPDSLWTATRRIVENNEFIAGSAIAFRENHYRRKGKFFSPFTFRNEGQIDSTQLGTQEYNYLEKEWYTKPLETGSGYWSEPYFDTGGGEMLMTTYSIPLTDDAGQTVAVMTADVSLKWLTDLVGEVEGYPHAFNILVSRSGKFMVCPEPSLIMKETVQEVAATLSDSAAVGTVARSMLSGNRGEQRVLYDGQEEYVFYAPIDRAGWSMAVVIPAKDIFGSVQNVGKLITLLQILGVFLLAYLVYVFIRKQRNLRIVSAKKNRIESELHVAREIQMSMLPKIFPPYPERDDIDMYGTIVPAKEVGGDLYDFYIRDEKLFFCIGDVSGKGIPASLVMAVTRSLFRTVSAHEKSPQRIVTSMNDSMSDMNESSMFVTFLVGVLDLTNGHLRYCNAGHNAPLRVGPGKTATLLEVDPNLPLGIWPGYRFHEQETDLKGGEGLVLYTDGLTEAENEAKELYGLDRLKQVAAEGGDQPAEQQMNRIVQAIKAHVGTTEPSDDRTMLIIRLTGDKPALGAERHLILHNDITQIPQLADFIETIAAEANLDQGFAMSLNLALEEAVSNVILYAYPKGSDGLVDVEAIIWKDRLDFIIVDSGVPFDPTAVSAPDLTLDVAERPIGGLGIYLVKNIMDQVSYARKDGKNILSMTKKL